MARFNQEQINRITQQNQQRTSTQSPVKTVQTSSMNRPTNPAPKAGMNAVLTEKGVVKTPVTNVASNSPIARAMSTSMTPQGKSQADLATIPGAVTKNTPVPQAQPIRPQVGTPVSMLPKRDLTPTESPIQNALLKAYDQSKEVQQPQGVQEVPTPQPQEPTMADQIMQAGQGMQEGAQQYLDVGTQYANEAYAAAENARRLDYISALSGTNAANMGVDLNSMSLEQLEQLAANSGIEPKKEVIDRIKEEGAAAIDDIRMERGDQLAENRFVADQTSRAFNRALDERERHNLAQDAKLRNAMNVLGGGSASQGSVVEVMGAAEQGRRAMEDLTAEFGGRMDSIGRQANAIIRQYGQIEREIQGQVTSAIEAKYAEVQKTMQDLRAQGVTNKKDLQAAMMPLMKEYIGLYNDATKWQAEQLFNVNKEMNQEAERLFRRSFDQDKELSNQSGVMYKNGQPLLDQNGEPVPTMAGLRDMSAIDYQQSQMTGVVYKNGAPLLDQNGEPIMTADLMKFQTTEDRLRDQFDRELGFKMSQEQFDQTMQAARFSQDQYEFEQQTGLKLTEQGFQELKFQAEMVEKGLEYGVNVNVSQPTASFNPANSKYGIQPTDGGISINAPTKGGKLVSPRRQCGMYVNDVIGIPSFFGDTIEQKKTKVTSATPTPGSAFVLDVPGLKWGHVGMVEQINPDGTIVISESNYDGNENFRRITTTMDALRQRGLVGFTGGLMTTPKIQKVPTPAGATGAQNVAESFAKIPKELQSVITSQVTQFKAEPQVKNFQMANDAYKIAQELERGSSGISDTALMFAYAKAQDPDSVVRDSEYATVVKNALSWSEKLGVNAAQVANGTAQLTPESRRRIVETIKQQYNARKGSYDSLRKQYAETIEDFGGTTDLANSLLKDYATAEPSPSAVMNPYRYIQSISQGFNP